MVESLFHGESADRRQHTEGVAGEENNVVGVAAHGSGLVVVDEVNRVRHTTILGLGNVVKVGTDAHNW